MENQHINSGNPRVDIEYRRRKSAEEMRYHIISFTLMIFLTIIAFATVAKDFSSWFTVPFILLLAAVQVVFQLYYFMHMNKRGHEAPTLYLYTGMLAGVMIVWAFSTIIWW